MAALPILDASRYLADPTGDAGRRFVEDVRDVVHEVGFFYLAGHGIDPAVPARLLGIARDAAAAGIDPESALRSAARRLRSDLMNAEGEGR